MGGYYRDRLHEKMDLPFWKGVPRIDGWLADATCANNSASLVRLFQMAGPSFHAVCPCSPYCLTVFRELPISLACMMQLPCLQYR